jgi:hypothetical protein
MNALRGCVCISLRENKIKTTQYNQYNQYNPIQVMQPNANALSRSIAIMDVREKIEKKQDNSNSNNHSLKGTGTNHNNSLKGTGTNNSNPHEIRDPHGILGLLRTDGSMRSRR